MRRRAHCVRLADDHTASAEADELERSSMTDVHNVVLVHAWRPPATSSTSLTGRRSSSGTLMEADLPASQAAFMADSQLPWGVEALHGEVSEAAWRTKPSWYLVAT